MRKKIADDAAKILPKFGDREEVKIAADVFKQQLREHGVPLTRDTIAAASAGFQAACIIYDSVKGNAVMQDHPFVYADRTRAILGAAILLTWDQLNKQVEQRMKGVDIP